MAPSRFKAILEKFTDEVSLSTKRFDGFDEEKVLRTKLKKLA